MFQFLVLLLISLVLNSAYEITLRNNRAIKGQIFEFSYDQKITMEIDGYLEFDERIYLTFL